MGKGTTPDAEILQFHQDIQTRLRSRIREAIEVVLEEELQLALGAKRYQRTSERLGHRNGSERRELTTPDGTRELTVPRGRLFEEGGGTREFESELLPRYQRRMRSVDDAILGTYLGGANTRRIRKALEPLLGSKHLSKSAVSRIVGRLKQLYAEWRERDLSGERYAILFLDAIYLKVRMARRVISVPVLAALGVQEDGQKVLVALEIAASEASRCWGDLMKSLIRRGLPEPLLLVTDGHAGLTKALQAWPEAKIQRCTQHKWQNLVAHCPKHSHAEMKRDWDAIIHAKDGLEAREAYEGFLRKWRKLCPSVARSLEEAGLKLLTFFDFPKEMWKGLRSTNTVENLNREFRRRTKTQASFGSEEAALTLLYGLVAFRHIDLRRITGYEHVTKLMRNAAQAAA